MIWNQQNLSLLHFWNIIEYFIDRRDGMGNGVWFADEWDIEQQTVKKKKHCWSTTGTVVLISLAAGSSDLVVLQVSPTSNIFHGKTYYRDCAVGYMAYIVCVTEYFPLIFTEPWPNLGKPKKSLHAVHWITKRVDAIVNKMHEVCPYGTAQYLYHVFNILDLITITAVHMLLMRKTYCDAQV